MKEGRCFKCRNTGCQANECPDKEDNKKKKGKEIEDERKRASHSCQGLVQRDDGGR
jgi:hypothetical protein